MKKLSCIFSVSLTLAALSALGAQTAQVRMYCLSVKLNQGTDELGDTLTITSTGAIDSGVGELLAGQNAGAELQLPTTQAYTSLFFLYDNLYDQTYGGVLYIDIPSPTDDNNNRFPDFFDLSLPVDF
jgi:hypothetical protein